MASIVSRAVLAATDLSKACDEVLRTAATLCARSGAQLHVLHALDFPPSPYLEPYPSGLTLQARMDAASAELEKQIARAVPPEVPVAGRKVDIYAAHRAIADHAAAIGADLIVLGPHVKRGVDPGFLGTTADRVIRTAAAPVLVVRGRPLRLPLRRVLVPLDLSEPARGALDVALRWCGGLGGGGGEGPLPPARVDLVHVIPRVFALPDMPFERATVLPGLNREVEAALQRLGDAARLEVHEELLWGDRAEDEIVAFAADAGADLVVLATHGYGAIKRALVGGTASGVARRAPCPVLLVPPRLWRSAGGRIVHDVFELAELIPAPSGAV